MGTVARDSYLWELIFLRSMPEVSFYSKCCDSRARKNWCIYGNGEKKSWKWFLTCVLIVLMTMTSWRWRHVMNSHPTLCPLSQPIAWMKQGCGWYTLLLCSANSSKGAFKIKILYSCLGVAHKMHLIIQSFYVLQLYYFEEAIVQLKIVSLVEQIFLYTPAPEFGQALATSRLVACL